MDEDLSPIHAAVLEEMKRQLLIVLVKRLGGTVAVPVAEIDATGGDLLAMNLDAETRIFTFTVVRKGEKSWKGS